MEHEIAVNTKKTKCMLFASKQQSKNTGKIYIENNDIDFVDKFKYLGVWIRPNLNNSEHLKQRKITTMTAAHKLNMLGLNTNVLTAELKSFLVNVYCRSALQYGIENSYLNEGDYREIVSLEARVIKRALALTKYHSTTLIINALDTVPLVTTIKMRKLNFVKQLVMNRLTNEIIQYQLGHKEKLATKSFLREIVRITGKNIYTLNAENIVKTCRVEVNKLKRVTEQEKSSKESKAIRYLLDHRSSGNDELLRTLTHWSTRRQSRVEK